MASFNTPIVTSQGLALLKSAIAGTDTLTFTHLIFSADDYTNSTDTQVASLTDISSKDMTTVPQSFTDTNGNVKVRAVGYNQSTSQAFNIKSYALYATNKAGAELLFAVSTSQTADFVPAYNGKQLNQVAYTFNFSVSSSNNITFSDTHDIAVTQADLASINASIQAVQNSLAHIDLSSAVKQAQSYTDSSVSSLSSQVVSSVASNTSAINNVQSSVNANSSAIANNSSAISSLQSNVNNSVSSNVTSLGNQIGSLSSATTQSIGSLSSSVSANSSAIASNANNISSLSSATSQSISAVQSSVSSNSSAIANNTNSINNLSSNGLAYKGTMHDNDDFNNYTTTGIYHNWGYNNLQNSPVSGPYWGVLAVYAGPNGTTQTVTSYIGYWFRYRSGGAWGAWQQLATENDVNQINANIAQAQSNAQSYADSKVQIFSTASQAQSYAQNAPAGTICIATGN